MARQAPLQPEHTSDGHHPVAEHRPGWGEPKPEHAPSPTYWPAVLGLGIAFLFWGLITTPLISLVGVGLGAVGLAGWIGELRHGE